MEESQTQPELWALGCVLPQLTPSPVLSPQGSWLYWPELSLGLEPPMGARAEPTLQLKGCACAKRSGPTSQVLGAAPLGCQGQNLVLAPDQAVSSQGSDYRAAAMVGSKTHDHSCPEGGPSSFSLALVSGWSFQGFLCGKIRTLLEKNTKAISLCESEASP